MDNLLQLNLHMVNEFLKKIFYLILNLNRLECGSVVWCKYKKYPYWPGIIWEKINKPTRILYEVLFFGTFSLGL